MSGHHPHSHSHSGLGWQLLLASALACGLLTLAGVWLDRLPGLQQLARAAYLAALVTGGWEAALGAGQRLKRIVLDIHFLMVAVAVGAAAIGAWWEGGALLFLFSLSNALEAMAEARTEREIHSLLDASPQTATLVESDGSERTVPAAALLAGQQIRIQPERRFPADAVILSGESAADESTLTGESEPVEKSAGDTVFGGTLNTHGMLLAQVLRPSGESAHARIIRLIHEAQASKAPSQRFTDKFGTAYTTGLLAFTLLMFLVWRFGFGLPAFSMDGGVRPAFYRAMTLLVVCSPCALVISIPSTILAGIAAGARRGILFRGGVALENLATINRLATDKTGTLTKGELEITGVESHPAGCGDRALGLAAALSRHSSHPVSRAISAEWDRRHPENNPPAANSLVSLPGQGLRAQSGGNDVLLGRRSLFPGETWLQNLPQPAPGISETLLAASDGLKARILLRDALRSESAGLIDQFRAKGVRVTMLSGDRPEAANLVGRQLHLDDVRAGLTPEGKVAAIREWQAAGERVAMLGDGVNDAPGLAAADISIGMGLRGADAVLEQADIVLVRDRLERLLEAFELSRHCRAIIRQNIAISLGVVLILAASALGGWIPLPLGVLGHEGSTVLVALNAMRLLLRK